VKPEIDKQWSGPPGRGERRRRRKEHHGLARRHEALCQFWQQPRDPCSGRDHNMVGGMRFPSGNDKASLGIDRGHFRSLMEHDATRGEVNDEIGEDADREKGTGATELHGPRQPVGADHRVVVAGDIVQGDFAPACADPLHIGDRCVDPASPLPFKCYQRQRIKMACADIQEQLIPQAESLGHLFGIGPASRHSNDE
jgi:hypothetical protein